MIQIRLWNDCYNNCAFCSIKDKIHKWTSVEDKKARINKLLELSDDTIGLIGGEFFEGQLHGCEQEWFNMIRKISCDRLYITANLIHDQYLLEETLLLRPDILLCTSYDTVGRFKNDIQKHIWLNRVKSLPNVFCTIVPTQDMLNDPFVEEIKCGINLCEPHLGLDWLDKVDKESYHENLIRDNKIFNLPKRAELLAWLRKHPRTLELMKNYKNTHFSTILGFDDNNNFVCEVENRFNDNNFIAECGHPYFSRCYADSDRCLDCDLEEL